MEISAGKPISKSAKPVTIARQPRILFFPVVGWSDAALFTLFLLSILGLQWIGGGFHREFDSIDDEASHFIVSFRQACVTLGSAPC